MLWSMISLVILTTVVCIFALTTFRNGSYFAIGQGARMKLHLKRNDGMMVLEGLKRVIGGLKRVSENGS